MATIFFFSGVLALVYEVVWQRQFALLLGSAAPATAAVLAAYFAGMGAGSFVIGRMADRWANPLIVYARLELLIALGAAIAAGFFPAVQMIYPWLYGKLAAIGAVFFGVKLAIAFVAIAPPAFCMGGTLPVLGKFADHSTHHLGITAGLLYATNTAGASLGALSVPFILLPAMGILGTLTLCIAGNLILAGWAWNLSKQPVTPASVDPQKPPRGKATPTGKGTTRIYLLAAISGVATFALQVLWNRAFAQVHENAVHSFATIVAVVILALAIGAEFARIALKRKIRPCALLSVSWFGAGIAILVGPWMFLHLTHNLSYLSTNGSWFDYAARLIGTAVAILLPPVMFMGVALPTIMEEAGQSSKRGTSDLLGRILLANIVGSVAGALLAGFAFPRILTLWQGTLLVGGLLLSVAVVLFAEAKHRWRPLRWIPASLAGAVVLSLSILKIDLPRVSADSSAGEKIINVAEGTHGITAVTERSGSRRLKLNNHYLLGGTASTGDERMQAHLPLLLHPAPHKVAFLGLGTGITAGGALFHPVDQITTIELVPEVVKAARTQFATANVGVVDDPRTRVIVDDARNFLRGSRERFDVIIGDLIVPWRQGEGALFTAESFAAARDSLATGGLFCQWIPCFQLSEDELRTLLRTFLSVFPEAMLWRGDFSPTEPAIAMIGWNGKFEFHPNSIEKRLSQTKPDPTNAHLLRPAIFWMYFLGTIRSRNAHIGAGPLNTDNRPVIELLGPLQGRDPSSRLMTGRRLQSFLNTLLDASQQTGAPPNPDQIAGHKAGIAFEEMMLQIAAGNFTAARESQATIRAALSSEDYKTLFP